MIRAQREGPTAAHAQSQQHCRLPPLTHAIYAAWEGISLRKPRSLGAVNWSLGTFMRSRHLSESILQGKKNTQWWSPCFCFKAKIFLEKFCILYPLTHLFVSRMLVLSNISTFYQLLSLRSKVGEFLFCLPLLSQICVFIVITIASIHID